MHKTTGIGMPSAKPEGIPVTELTYGTAVGLAELFIPCADNDGIIDYGVIVDEDTLRRNILLITEVMPWGVLAASSIKLCNRLVGFLGDNGDFKIDVWNETKKLIIANTPPIAKMTDVEAEKLGEYIQSFVNDSILNFLVGEDISDIVNPTILESTDYEYAVAIGTLSSSIISASANIRSITPNEMADKLHTELHKIASSSI